MKEKIIKLLEKEISLGKKEIENLIEVPPSADLGDFSFPCFTLAKKEKKSPAEIALSLAKKISSKEIEKTEAKGPYLNFFVNYESVAEYTLKKVQKEKDEFGSLNEGKNKKALIEHTSINPNASPHMGRARNALIGDSIVRILNFQKFKTEAHFFVNDVGKQIAFLVLGARKSKDISFKSLLKIYIKINNALESNPQIEEEAFDLLRELESGDKKTKREFRKIVDICIKGQKEILEKLDIHYDFFDYESEYLWGGKTTAVLDKIKKTSRLTEDDEGRFVLNQEGYNLPVKSPILVLTRADKTSLYPLRDLAYTIDKLKKNSKNNFIVLGEDQKTYFLQLKSALDILGYSSPRAVHYSFVLLKDGKMSTRKGNLVLLEDFMSEAFRKAEYELKKREGKSDKKRAEKIAQSAIKYSMLRVDPSKNVTFNLEEALSFEGNTGPYLLYTYARARSILRKAKYRKSKFKIQNLSRLEKGLIKQISNFPNIALHSYKSLAPNIIANYAHQISQAFNEFYHSEKVIGSEGQAFKLSLVDAFSQTLKNSLSLLGIEVLEKM